MNLLHISVAGIQDKFYPVFFDAISKSSSIIQTVYIPYDVANYKDEDFDVISKYKQIGVRTIARPIKNKSDRLLYRKKIIKYMRDLEKQVDLSDVDMIHAHSLYSDGGVAYLLNKKYNIPYVVAVRVTDTAFFMKYFKMHNSFARRILENAKRVVFITPSLKQDTIVQLYKKEEKCRVDRNAVIIPNGINDFWIENTCQEKKSLHGTQIRLIQVGRLNNNKNVDKTIRAIRLLRNMGFDATLEVLGDGENREALELLTSKLSISEYVSFRGFISDLAIIKHYYNMSDIFVLPSSVETFGLTYIEAMTQGLPIIGVNHTGVSDYYDQDEVGHFIDSPDENEIVRAVMIIRERYASMSQACIINISQFRWAHIVDQYVAIYYE